MANVARFALPPFLVFWLVVGIWCLLSYVVLAPSRRFLLPPPIQVVRVGFLNHENRNTILSAMGATVETAALGFAIAVLIGALVAVLMSQERWIERSLYPYAVIVQTIPILALLPVIGFWLGHNVLSRVVICVIISLFPIITNVLFGLQSVDPALRDIFTLHGTSRWTMLRKLEAPTALPAFFTGLRIAAGASILGSIFGEFLFDQGAPGLGTLINEYSAQLETQQLYATILASSLIGVVAFLLVGMVGRLLFGAWHESAVQVD